MYLYYICLTRCNYSNQDFESAQEYTFKLPTTVKNQRTCRLQTKQKNNQTKQKMNSPTKRMCACVWACVTTGEFLFGRKICILQKPSIIIITMKIPQPLRSWLYSGQGLHFGHQMLGEWNSKGCMFLQPDAEWTKLKMWANI